MPRWVLAAVVVSLAGCGGAEPPRLVVSAASSLRTALAGYADARYSFAGSDELAAQIRQGVAPDVFAAADTDLAEQLHEEGLVGEPVEFAANRLVLAVPGGSPVRSLDDLAEPGVKLVIGSPSVPVGAYAREVLDRLPGGQGERILANVRSNEPDVAGVVGKLSQGAADAGFVYATDVAATDGAIEAIELPEDVQPRVTYAVAVVTGAQHQQEAKAFVDGLLGGAGREALRKAGFDPPPGQ